MIPIRLTWARPTDGVELVDGICRPPRTDRRDAVTYEIEDLTAPIVVELANAPIADGRDFLDRFGMLFDKPSSGVSYMNARDAFRSLIFFLNEPKDTLLFGKLNAALAETALTPVMQYRNGGPQLYAVPPSLYHLMALEVAFAATHGAKSRVCPICSRVFLTGPYTNRRSTATYCQNKCRAVAQRQRTAQEA